MYSLDWNLTTFSLKYFHKYIIYLITFRSGSLVAGIELRGEHLTLTDIGQLFMGFTKELKKNNTIHIYSDEDNVSVISTPALFLNHTNGSIVMCKYVIF